MGDEHLGILRSSRKWRHVVDLIRTDGDAAAIATATMDAADKGFRAAADDEGVIHATWLLAQLPIAARSPDFVKALNDLGLAVGSSPGIFDLVGAFTDAVDAHMLETGRPTDLGEMAHMAAAETIASVVGQRAAGLFETRPEDVHRELRDLATVKQFGTFARDFFARLTRRYLMFYLSRELPSHIGGDRRFANAAEQTQFGEALERHCRETSYMVEKFAGEWFSKNKWETGITPDNARGFTWKAMDKLRGEFKKRGTE